MVTFQVPKSFHEVFGEHQTKLEVGLTLFFAAAGCLFIFAFLYPKNSETSIPITILGLLLVGDVLAGCIANFTQRTNDYYANRPKSRWVFIGMHFHIIVIAWLLDGPLMESTVVWGFTIASAIVVNVLDGNRVQLFIAANLVGIGIFVIFALEMPMWFVVTSLFFMIKVVLSFSVDHYPSRAFLQRD